MPPRPMARPNALDGVQLTGPPPATLTQNQDHGEGHERDRLSVVWKKMIPWSVLNTVTPSDHHWPAFGQPGQQAKPGATGLANRPERRKA